MKEEWRGTYSSVGVMLAECSRKDLGGLRDGKTSLH